MLETPGGARTDAVELLGTGGGSSCEGKSTAFSRRGKLDGGSAGATLVGRGPPLNQSMPAAAKPTASSATPSKLTNALRRGRSPAGVEGSRSLTPWLELSSVGAEPASRAGSELVAPRVAE